MSQRHVEGWENSCLCLPLLHPWHRPAVQTEMSRQWLLDLQSLQRFLAPAY